MNNRKTRNSRTKWKIKISQAATTKTITETIFKSIMKNLPTTITISIGAEAGPKVPKIRKLSLRKLSSRKKLHPLS